MNNGNTLKFVLLDMSFRYDRIVLWVSISELLDVAQYH